MKTAKESAPKVTREVRIAAALIAEALDIGDDYILEVSGSEDSVDIEIVSDQSRNLAD